MGVSDSFYVDVDFSTRLGGVGESTFYVCAQAVNIAYVGTQIKDLEWKVSLFECMCRFSAFANVRLP